MIFIDSNVPMYMVGSPHPNRERALALTTHLARQDERMITSVEVYQEILHRYTAIHRPEAIDVAFEALDSIVDQVMAVEMMDIHVARALILTVDGLSARDALHLAVMRRAGTDRILSFDQAFDACPGVERLS